MPRTRAHATLAALAGCAVLAATATIAQQTESVTYKGNCRTGLDRPISGGNMPPQLVAIGPVVLGAEPATLANTVVCNVSADRRYEPIRGLRVKLDAEVIESRGNRLPLGSRSGRTDTDGSWATSFHTQRLDDFLRGPGDFVVLVSAQTTGGKKVDAIKVECTLSREEPGPRGACFVTCGCNGPRPGLNLSLGACMETGRSWMGLATPDLCANFNPACWETPHQIQPYTWTDGRKCEIRAFDTRVEVWIDTDLDGDLELAHTQTGSTYFAHPNLDVVDGTAHLEIDFHDQMGRKNGKWNWKSR